MANIRDNESESGSVRTKAKDGSMNLKQRDASLKKRETVKGRNCFLELFHRLDCGCLSRLVHWKTQHEGDQGIQDDSTQERLTDLHIIAEQPPSRDDDVMVAALNSRDADCGSRSAQSPPLKRQDTPSSWKQKSLKDKPAHTIYGNKIQRHHTSTSMTSRSSRNSDARGSVSKRSSTTSPRTASAITRRNHQRVILMLANVVVVFFICWMPYRAVNLWVIYSTAQEHKRLTPQQIVAIITVCRVLVYLNSAINPILYNLISTKFRAAFKSVLPCASLHGRRRSMSSRSLSSTSSFRFTKKSVDHAC